MKRALGAVAFLLAGCAFVVFTAFGQVASSTAGAMQAQALSGGVCASGAGNADSVLAPPGKSAGSNAPLSYLQVAKAAYAAGFRGEDLVIAGAVATAESGRVPRSTNQNTNGTRDLGLFQINTIHTAILASGDPMDAADNARMAFQVFTDAGSRWGPWVTFWSGSYRQFLDASRAAVEGSDLTADRSGNETPSLTGLFGKIGCDGQQAVDGGVTDPGSGAQGSDGLTPRAAAVKASTLSRWGCAKISAPCISTIGGYAPRNIAGTGTPSDHASGNADDIMVPDWNRDTGKALGDSIANFWVANASKAGVHYVIWNAKIWSTEHSTEGWRTYHHPSGTSSPTLDHLNHVHVSVVH